MTKEYRFAIMPSAGMYGHGLVSPIRCGDTLETLQKAAEKMTRDYRSHMSQHGGTSGSYRVIRWDRPRSSRIWADVLDREKGI